MRIAAGILLIISFLINLSMGGCAVIGGSAGSAIQDEAAKEGINLTTEGMNDEMKKAMEEAGAADVKLDAEAQKAMDDLNAAMGELESMASPTMYLVFGVFMILSSILQLVAAIFLFTNKQKMMILIFTVFGIAVALWGMFGGFLGFGGVSYPTLLACVLGLIGGLGVGKEEAAA